VYNCTTCARKKEQENLVWKLQHPEQYKITCGSEGLFPGFVQTGPRWNDIACPRWDRLIPIPKKGYMPGIETGKYDPLDRK
jgi:hypothetical protein